MGVHELAAAALAALLSAGGDLTLPQAEPQLLVGQVGEQGRVSTGGTGALSLTLRETPAAGFPLAVVIDKSPLSLRDHRLSWTDVVDPLAHQPRLSAPFVAPDAAAKFVVRALVSYVICDASRCLPRRARVAWSVEVVAPPTPSGPEAPDPADSK